MSPAAGSELPEDIVQLHAAEYRTADSLPAGSVLVVGSGQSGVQVVEDLLEAGREVYLCTGRVGRVPRRYRGRDVLEWMMQIGMAEQRPADLEDPNEVHARQPQISGTQGGHSVSCHQLARAGVTLLGRFEGVDGRVLRVGSDLLANVAQGDEQCANVRAGIDMFIEKAGIDAPPAEPDPVDAPFEGLESMAARRTLDLDEANIRSVIYCTGFGSRFDYLDSGLLDESGRPRHEDGVCEAPGLYCLGFTWLRRRFSGLVAGVDADAEHIAGPISARRQARAAATPRA
jgi:putative flavoprotein involved in K+ transport